MPNTCKHYIDGQWVDSQGGRTIAVMNPATDASATDMILGTAADVDAAVIAARRAFETFSLTSKEERIALLERIMAEYQKRIPDMARAIATEMGCPISIAQTAQAGSGLGHLAQSLAALKDYEFSEKIGDNRVVREAIGVVALITPWNWPMNQIVAKVGPALAAGCTMILKPSEEAPSCAAIFAEIMHAAAVPAGVFNLVQGDGDGVGTALARHPDIDMVSFTGSTRAGIMVAKNAADTVKRVAQELGGKSPNIIMDDADLEAAVTRGVLHMYNNTGQSCNAPSRMLVPRAMLADAEAIAAKVSETVVIGDTADENTTMGPVVSKVQWDKIQGLIQQGIDEGAKLVCGGTGLPDGIEKGYYVRPTVFSEANNDMVIAREEIFGPVLVMIPYDTEEEAIRIANDTPYGLAGYIQGEDIDRARKLATKIRAGNIHLNGAAGGSDIPFGGFKQSGNGREWGAHGFTDYLEIKAIEGYSAA